MKITIRMKLIAITLTLIIATVATIGYVSYHKARAMMTVSLQDKLITEAELYSEMIDKYIAERGRDIIVITSHPRLRDQGVPNEEKSYILKEFKDNYGCYDSISMVDARGLQIADSEGIVGSDKSDLEWFQVGSTGQLYISDVRISRDLQKPVLNFGYPVKDNAGAIVGVVTTRLLLEDTIWAMVDGFEIREGELGRSSYAYMTNKDGLLIAHSNKEMVLKDNVLTLGYDSLKIMGEKMIRGETGCDWYHFQGVDKYGAYAPLNGYGDYKGQGWSINLAVSEREFMTPVAALGRFIIFTGLVAVALSILLTTLFAGYLVKPINLLLEKVRVISTGDLRARAEVNSMDEIGQLAAAFNNMVDGLRNLVVKVVEGSSSMAAHSQELSALSQEVSSTVQEIAGGASQVSATAEQGLNNSERATEMSIGVEKNAQRGGQAVEESMERMNSIQRATDHIAVKINSLHERSQRIGQIIQVITGIADQTNLLALNAAIEAARAGEHGRGFAVVAEEVRKLAEQSAQASEEIKEIIVEVQNETTEAVESMETGKGEVNDGVKVARYAGEALYEIIGNIKENALLINQIAGGSRQISEVTMNLAASSEQVSSAVQQVAGAANNLAEMSFEFKSLVESFKV